MVGRRTPTIVARDNARGSAQEEDGRASERGPADIYSGRPGGGDRSGRWKHGLQSTYIVLAYGSKFITKTYLLVL